MRARLTYANVMATIAVFIALGGSSYAAITITGRNVKNGSLTGADIRDRSLRAQDFKQGELPKGPKGDAGPQGPKGPQGPQGPKGVLGVYEAFLPITLPASDVARVGPNCNAGDRATGGGYFLNTTTLSDAQLNVEVFSNSSATAAGTVTPTGWDVGIRNKTTTPRSGFAYVICADLAP